MKSQTCSTISDDKKMMQYWDYDKNIIDPKVTKRISNFTVYLKCPKCGYEWNTRARDTIKCNCPCCEDNKVLVSGINDVATLFPDIVKEFPKELNPDFDITNSKINSTATVTWKCPRCGKVWNTLFKSRIRKNSNGYYLSPCPSCVRKRIPVAPDDYNLEVLFPAIAKELSKKNQFKAIQLFPYSKQTMIWKCENGHEWKDTIKNRTILGRGCKKCAKYRTLFFDQYPELLKNFSKNNTISPFEYTKWSKQKALWVCENGHEISLSFSDITESKGIIKCKYCDGIVPCNGETSLFDTIPELRNEWCSEENTLLGINMREIFPTSEKIAYWKCQNNHKYPLMILKRVEYYQRGRNACPLCKGIIRRKDKFS